MERRVEMTYASTASLERRLRAVVLPFLDHLHRNGPTAMHTAATTARAVATVDAGAAPKPDAEDMEYDTKWFPGDVTRLADWEEYVEGLVQAALGSASASSGVTVALPPLPQQGFPSAGSPTTNAAPSSNASECAAEGLAALGILEALVGLVAVQPAVESTTMRGPSGELTQHTFERSCDGCVRSVPLLSWSVEGLPQSFPISQ